MKSMRFDVECVMSCLELNKFVYSVRGWKYYENKCLVGDVECNRNLIKIVDCKEDLEEFVEYSGFDNVSDWFDKIVMFCGDKVKYLYFVFASGQLDLEARRP